MSRAIIGVSLLLTALQLAACVSAGGLDCSYVGGSWHCSGDVGGTDSPGH